MPTGGDGIRRSMAELVARQYSGLGLVRALNEQVVLETVFRDGPISRAGIARLTGLSKPTVSSVVQTLEACGLIHQQGTASGNIGRPSTLYEVNSRAGTVLGVDIGGTKVRVGIADLFGDVLADSAEPTAAEDGEAIVSQVARMGDEVVQRSGVDRRFFRAAGVGIPGVFDPTTDHVSAAPNLPGLTEIPVLHAFVEALGVPISLDNDVNLAAVGERWRGLAQDEDHFVAISIGTGVGMGVVLGGEIYRGSRGAAGEIDYLPLDADPFDPHPVHGPLESVVTGPALLDRLRRKIESGAETSASPEGGVQGIFQAEAHGDQVAAELVDEEARLIALAIAAVASVLDPRLVVLGGGLGSNPGLLEPVRRYLAKLFPREVDIQTSALGDRAAFYGAIAMGLRAARQRLLAEVTESR
jgi:predicted NBD/HSP70 family sugar kinase